MKVNFYDYNNNKYVEFEQNDLLNKKNVVFESIVKKGKNKPKKDQIKKDLANYIKDEEILNEIMGLSRSELLDMFYDSEVHKKIKGKDGKTKVEYLWSFDEEKIDNWIDEKIPVVYAEEEVEVEEPNEDKKEDKANKKNVKEEKPKKEDIDKKEEPEKKEKEKEEGEEKGEDYRYNRFFPIEQRALYIYLNNKLTEKTRDFVKETSVPKDCGYLFKLLKNMGNFNKGDIFFVGNKEEASNFAKFILLSEFKKQALMRWAENNDKEDIEKINDWEDKFNDFNFKNDYYSYYRDLVNEWADQPSKSGKFINRLVEIAYKNVKNIGQGIKEKDFVPVNKADNQYCYIAPDKDTRSFLKMLAKNYKTDDALIDKSTEILKQFVIKWLFAEDVSDITLSEAFTEMFGKDWYKKIHSPHKNKKDDEYFQSLSKDLDDAFKEEDWVKFYIDQKGGLEDIFDFYCEQTTIIDVPMEKDKKEEMIVAQLDMNIFESMFLSNIIKKLFN